MSRPPMQQFSNSIQEIPHPMQQVSPRHRAMRRPMTRTECISTREPWWLHFYHLSVLNYIFSLTDSECTQGQTCRSGRRSNKCVCHCSNFKKCSSDADCSGLIGACVFEPPTFPFFDPRFWMFSGKERLFLDLEVIFDNLKRKIYFLLL